MLNVSISSRARIGEWRLVLWDPDGSCILLTLPLSRIEEIKRCKSKLAIDKLFHRWKTRIDKENDKAARIVKGILDTQIFIPFAGLGERVYQVNTPHSRNVWKSYTPPYDFHTIASNRIKFCFLPPFHQSRCIKMLHRLYNLGVIIQQNKKYHRSRK